MVSSVVPMATRVKPSTEKSRTAMRVRGRTDPRWFRQTRRVTTPMETPPGSEISRADGGREREGARIDGAVRRLRGQRHHDAADAAEVGQEVPGGDDHVVRVEIGQAEPRHAVGERLEPAARPGVLQERAHVVPGEAHELGPSHLDPLRVRLGHAWGGEGDGRAGRGGHGGRRVLIRVDQVDHVTTREAAGVGGEGRRGAAEVGPEGYARRRCLGDLDHGRREAGTGQPQILLHHHSGPRRLLRLGAVVTVGADLAARGDDTAHRGHDHAEDAAGDQELGEAHPTPFPKDSGERMDRPAELPHGIVTCPDGCTVTVSEAPLECVMVSTPAVLAVPKGVKTGEAPVRLTSLGTAITPALFVSWPIQAAPAQLPWRSCTPPGTAWRQMFWRVWMATMRAW